MAIEHGWRKRGDTPDVGLQGLRVIGKGRGVWNVPLKHHAGGGHG